MVGADSVKRRAVPSQLLQEERPTARRMVGADGVRRRAAPSQLQATRATAWHMVEDDSVSRRAVLSQLEAIQATAWRMVGDDGVKRRAAPRQLLQEARPTARHMAEGDGVKRRTASTWLLHAACTAGSAQRMRDRAICTVDSTTTAAHGSEQSGHGQNRARVPGGSAVRGRGPECDAEPRLGQVLAASLIYTYEGHACIHGKPAWGCAQSCTILTTEDLPSRCTTTALSPMLSIPLCAATFSASCSIVPCS